MNLIDCFNTRFDLKIDPYRKEEDDQSYMDIYDTVFDESGRLKDRTAIKELILGVKPSYLCDLVGLYHADIHASSTKGSYPTIYYFR